MPEIEQIVARHAEGYLQSLWRADPLLAYLLKTAQHSCHGTHLRFFPRFRRRVVGQIGQNCRMDATLPWKLIWGKPFVYAPPYKYCDIAECIENAVKKITSKVRRGVLGKKTGFAALFSKRPYAGLDLKRFELKPGRINISDSEWLEKCVDHLKAPGYLLVGKGLFDWMDTNYCFKGWRKGTVTYMEMQLVPCEHIKAARAYAFTEGALRLHLLTDSLLGVQKKDAALSPTFTINFFGAWAFESLSQVVRIQ